MACWAVSPERLAIYLAGKQEKVSRRESDELVISLLVLLEISGQGTVQTHARARPTPLNRGIARPRQEKQWSRRNGGYKGSKQSRKERSAGRSEQLGKSVIVMIEDQLGSSGNQLGSKTREAVGAIFKFSNAGRQIPIIYY